MVSTLPLHSLAYGSVPLPDPDWVKNVDGNVGWFTLGMVVQVDKQSLQHGRD